jgi:hypothetical protein
LNSFSQEKLTEILQFIFPGTKETQEEIQARRQKKKDCIMLLEIKSSIINES